MHLKNTTKRESKADQTLCGIFNKIQKLNYQYICGHTLTSCQCLQVLHRFSQFVEIILLCLFKSEIIGKSFEFIFVIKVTPSLRLPFIGLYSSEHIIT